MLKVIILIYILSILGIRWTYRQHVKKKLWLKENGVFEIVWVIPIINTIAFLLTFVYLLVDNTKKLELSVENKYLKKILNLDL